MGKRGVVYGVGGETRERQVGREEVTNHKVAKNDSWEAIFILLSNGKLVKGTWKSFGDYDLLGHLTQFLKKSIGKTFVLFFFYSWIFSLKRIETHWDNCRGYGMYVMYGGVISKCRGNTGMGHIVKLSRRPQPPNDSWPLNIHLRVKDSASFSTCFPSL